MYQTPMYRWLFLVMALAASAPTQFQAVGQDKPANSQDKPYTISKETTYFTGPLKPDGSIDFVGAINAYFSNGVSPEDHFARVLVPLLEPKTFWNWKDPDQRDRLLRFLKLNPTDLADVPTFRDYDAFAVQQGWYLRDSGWNDPVYQEFTQA